ncbi:hypothetical protein EZS27_035964, partial [termite gut metagenome]
MDNIPKSASLVATHILYIATETFFYLISRTSSAVVIQKII